LLCGLHGQRLRGWYHREIWSKPMVWVLFLAYAWIVLGFFFKALMGLGLWGQSVATHAFAAGGMGMMVLGMMARISLGHTGRNVNQPPQFIGIAFLLILVAACLRVFGPIVYPEAYSLWIWVAQIDWVAGFALFLVIYFPVLIRARVDGLRG
jgi:uncharacterized protein involved in response to NO